MDMVTILIQATALMMVLILLRPLLKRYLSARWCCALWALPALRLLLPFEWESAMSVMAPMQPVAQEVESVVNRPVAQIAPSGWLGTAVGAPITGNTVQNTVQNAAQSTAPIQSAATAPEISLGRILLVLWLVGAVITGGIILYQNIRFYSGAKRLAEPCGMAEKLPVYLVRGLPSPCLAGVFKPRIYINEHTLVSEDVLTMTLRHELTHYRRRDHIWGAVRGVLLALYWFHPLVWYCSELFRSDCETACDAAATRGMSKDERESYGMALISLASRSGKRDAGRLVCLSTMGGSKKLLKERITRLAKGRTFRFAAVFALLLAAVLCCTMCTVPHEEETPDSLEDISSGNQPATPVCEPVEIKGHVLVDGAPRSVRMTLTLEDVLKGDEAYEILSRKNADLEYPDSEHEYVIVTFSVVYNGGAVEMLSLSENRATLDDAKLYFSLSNAESNAIDVTDSLEDPIYDVTLPRGGYDRGKVAFLQEKDNENPLYFVGFGQQSSFLINWISREDPPDAENIELDIVEWEISTYDPALGGVGTLEDLAWSLELTVYEKDFVHMDEDEINSIVSEYEYLIDDYRFMGRVSEDGTIRYIVGEYQGDFPDCAFYGLYSIETNNGDQFLYRPEDVDAVEEDMFNGRTPVDGILLKNSRVTHFSNSSLILIQPNTSTVPLDGVCYRYMEGQNGRSYILDAVSRGISVGATSEPYLEVYRISELYGEISERIALTEEEAEQILSEPMVKLKDGYGIVATLHYNGETTLYSEFKGVPQTVIHLARKHCEYRFSTPASIEGNIVKATLECNWLYQPLYAAEEDLPRLREILKGAEFEFVGACGYGAKLTIEMENGETMVLFKGTDSCDTIVFGSYGGYTLGNKQNIEFWEIFGLDPETKELRSQQQALQNMFPMELLFASGAGAWGTTLTLNLDGTFTGQFYDSNMGENGENYPNGTVYYCNFSGRFGSMMKLNDYAYYMRLEELAYDTDIGREQIGGEEGIRYVTAEPYGIAGGEEFIFYLPGTPVEELNEDFLSWWPSAYLWRGGSLYNLDGYGLFNVNTGDGFFSNWVS